MATVRTLPEKPTEPGLANPLALIGIQNVFVEYGQPGKPPKRILNGVTLDIQAGEFISIVGQTGCGKSTLLRLVLAEEMPGRGQVLVEGSPRTQPDQRCGYVPQKYSLFPDRTVLQNITFGLDVTEVGFFGGLSPARRARRREFQAEAIGYLRRMGLRESDASKYPHQLSGGMQQRVAIAQALIMRPKILLMDEAFSALDPGTRAGMQRLIKDLWRETGTTVLFVTHNPREAVVLATRIIALGRTAGLDDGANIVLDLPVPDTNDEIEIAALARRVEETTFPGGAEMDEAGGAPEV
ncbi:MAG TPA: ATP-binding cassette domain-containing protein [Bryobacteraceae bacterium]|nr:ATP-binding cassette domain-containing protein [Bryobacteraceae bacterium]